MMHREWLVRQASSSWRRCDGSEGCGGEFWQRRGSAAKTLYQGERSPGEGLSVSGREITFLPTYAFISWGQLTAKRLETLRFLSYCDVEEGVFSRGTGFPVSRSTDRDLGKLRNTGSTRIVPSCSKFTRQLLKPVFQSRYQLILLFSSPFFLPSTAPACSLFIVELKFN